MIKEESQSIIDQIHEMLLFCLLLFLLPTGYCLADSVGPLRQATYAEKFFHLKVMKTF